MRKKKLSFLIIISLLWLTVANIAHCKKTAWGLPHRKVFAIAIQNESRTWIGTENGLALYDGKKFTHYFVEDGLPHNDVTSIALSRDRKQVWFGTFGGIATYVESPRRGEKQFKNYTTKNSGLINNVIYGLACQGDEGNDLWIATTDGASHFDQRRNKWKTWNMDNAPFKEVWCYDVKVDEEDVVWFGVWGSGVLRVERKKNWTEFADPDHLFDIDVKRNDGNLHEIVTGVALADGIMWCGAYFGLSRYDGKRWWNWTVKDSDCGLPSDFINTVQARGQTVWLGTDKGLCSFNWTTKKWVSYSRLPNGKGLVKTFQNGKWTEEETSEAIPDNFVWSIAFDGDDIWVGTSAGIGVGKFERSR